MAEIRAAKKLAALAKLRYIHVSPQKARLVVNQIRGKQIDEALTILRHSRKAISKDLEKLVLSAVANAQASGGIEDIERDVIQRALRKYNGNISQSAKELGLTRASLYRRLEKYGL